MQQENCNNNRDSVFGNKFFEKKNPRWLWQKCRISKEFGFAYRR